ncbi:FkbM family methyltransferase [bacterium]|nr:FkbM family methyltransferase [bacterium]
MSHDIKKFKLLKKIIGAIGYKLIDKKSAKSERIIENFSIKIEDILKHLIRKKKITKIIQIGANDGKSDDFLFNCFDNNLEAILIEPIEDAFKKLEKNYENFVKAKCLNLAVDIDNKSKEIFCVNKKFYEFYKKKYNDVNVEWLDVLSSFNKKHLINHGIKEKHIVSKFIECKTISELINQYKFQNLDLLIIDVEGYDLVILNNFIQTINIKPMIIFEWIHAQKNEIEKMLIELEDLNYKFLRIGRDLICYQKDFLF